MQIPLHVCDVATDQGSQTITNLQTLIVLSLSINSNPISITAIRFLESLVNMENIATTKYTLKAKDEVKERLYDRSNKATTKTLAKENGKPQEFKLHTEQRAYRRAMFNHSVATKLYIMELQKKQIEKIQKIIEEEEIRMLRKEMIPRAQLMPFFDRPFFPQRSSRPLTIPREPSFHMLNSKC